LCYLHWEAEKIRQGDHFGRKTWRYIVYFVSLQISLAVCLAVEAFVRGFRDYFLGFLFFGAVVVAALIFFILQCCGVYLHEPITTAKPPPPLDLLEASWGLENAIGIVAIAIYIAIALGLMAWVVLIR
jgi:hypothetical protein